VSPSVILGTVFQIEDSFEMIAKIRNAGQGALQIFSRHTFPDVNSRLQEKLTEIKIQAAG
jgi:hypothetical protein